MKTEVTKEDEILEEFLNKLINNQKSLPQEFSKIIDEHFWELLEE